MKTRITSITEFSEKIHMASTIQKLMLKGTAKETDASIYNVLMSEIKEYEPIFLSKKPTKK